MAKAKAKYFTDYRVGDKVRVTEDFYGLNEGLVSTITDIDEGDAHLTYELNCGRWANKTVIEPVFENDDKVRIKDVGAISLGSFYWKSGDITEVVYVDTDDMPYLKSCKDAQQDLVIVPREFHAIERVREDEETAGEAGELEYLELEYLHARINDLTARVSELEAKLSAEPNVNIEVDGEEITETIWKEAVKAHEETFMRSANERRAEVIEKAWNDVDAIVARGKDIDAIGWDVGNSTYRRHFYVVEFIVNEKKRTAVALVYIADIIGEKLTKVNHRGIAKCNPDDVFNADIGKAIAVRRAFDLPIPDEYVNAPQPDEVVDGMVITFPAHDDWHRIVEYVVDGFGKRIDNLIIIKDDVDSESYIGERAYGGYCKHLPIISDTNAEYEVRKGYGGSD